MFSPKRSRCCGKQVCRFFERSVKPGVHPCSVKRFAVDVVEPKVREMDEQENMDPSIIKGLFEQGVRTFIITGTRVFIYDFSQLMGIETSPDQGGAGCSFTSAIIAIEELAKVDPSVSVLCDVHNTLVNTVIRKYGT